MFFWKCFIFHFFFSKTITRQLELCLVFVYVCVILIKETSRMDSEKCMLLFTKGEKIEGAKGRRQAVRKTETGRRSN